MFLVELVMQGVRGFRERTRLRFQGGFNFVSAGNEAGKTAAVDTMQMMLFPIDQPDRRASLVSRYVPESSRSALVMQADDGKYYRVIQDFSKSAVSLSKYDAATKDFILMHKDWDSTARFVAGLTTGITEEEYAGLYIIRRDQHPGHPVSSIAPAAVPAPKATPPLVSGTAKAGETRLAELRETLRKAEEAADAEYRLQSSKLRQVEIRKKLESLEMIDNRFLEMEARIAEFKGCESLPVNLAELIESHVQQQSRKMADSDELTQQSELLKGQLDAMPVANILTDKLFIGGAAVGVLSLLAATFVLTKEQQYFFPIGILLALTLAAVAWYKGTRKSAQRKVVLNELSTLEADRAALGKSFEQGGSAITSFLKATGAKTTEELRDKADNYRQFLSLRNELAEQRQRIGSGNTQKALLEDNQRQEQEVIELEKAARDMAPYAVDTYSIRQEIERVESEAGSGSAPTAWDTGEPDQDAFGAAPGMVASEPGFLTELAMASRVGEIEMQTLIPAVEAAAQRNLTAITAGKYARIDLRNGEEPVLYTGDDTVVKAPELSPSTRELLSFCVRTGIVEALAGKRRLPLLLDDPLAAFDPVRQKAACQVLRTLGTRTQVILFTSNPALKADGDVTAVFK